MLSAVFRAILPIVTNLTVNTAGTSSAAIRTDRGGGTVELNMTKQRASGDIYIDSISTLTMNMKNGSYYEGAINSDNCAKSISLSLDASSKIKLTGDTYLTELNDDDTTYSNIDFNGYTLYVNSKAIN